DQRHLQLIGLPANDKLRSDIRDAMISGQYDKGAAGIVHDLEEGFAPIDPDSSLMFVEFGPDFRFGVQFDLRSIRQCQNLVAPKIGRIDRCLRLIGRYHRPDPHKRNGGNRRGCNMQTHAPGPRAGVLFGRAECASQRHQSVGALPSIANPQIRNPVRRRSSQPLGQRGVVLRAPVFAVGPFHPGDRLGFDLRRRDALAIFIGLRAAHDTSPSAEGSPLIADTITLIPAARCSATVASLIPMRLAISRRDSPSILRKIIACRRRSGSRSSALRNLPSSDRAADVRSGPGSSLSIDSCSKSATDSIEITWAWRMRSTTRLRAIVMTNGLAGSGILFCAAS